MIKGVFRIIARVIIGVFPIIARTGRGRRAQPEVCSVHRYPIIPLHLCRHLGLAGRELHSGIECDLMTSSFCGLYIYSVMRVFTSVRPYLLCKCNCILILKEEGMYGTLQKDLPFKYVLSLGKHQLVPFPESYFKNTKTLYRETVGEKDTVTDSDQKIKPWKRHLEGCLSISLKRGCQSLGVCKEANI